MTSRVPNIPPTTEGTAGHPDVVFAHANGLCKEVWRPVVTELKRIHPDVRWLSADLKGHGSNTAGDGPYTLESLAVNLLETLDGFGPAVGVGHSSGGTTVARAELIRPGTFTHLILIEPIIFPPPYRLVDNPFAASAERRREVFSDRRAAYERFEDSPFAVWKPEAIAAYVDFGFDDSPEGWKIKCQPSVEAEIFRQGLNHDTWDRVGQIDVPVTIVAGEHSDTHAEPYLSSLTDRFTDASLVVVEDVGHFVPMERPDVVAAMVAAAIDHG